VTVPDESCLLDGSFFWFVRHGESVANRDGTTAGTLDSPLTERGRCQAVLAARLLASSPPACIWTGKMSRVRETASIIGGLLGVVPREDEEIRERNWGAWEGRPRLERTGTESADGEFNVESWERYRNVTLAALRRLRGPRPLLIVGHSGNYRVLSELLLEASAGDQIPNAVPVRFERCGKTWRQIILNAG